MKKSALDRERLGLFLALVRWPITPDQVCDAVDGIVGRPRDRTEDGLPMPVWALVEWLRGDDPYGDREGPAGG